MGASTAKVITAAVRGELPERLAELEAEHGGPLTKGGQELHAQLRGDLHSHSDWSDGGSPIEEMAFTAIELGHEYQVLTDHSPRLRVANGLCVERLQRQLGVVDAVNEHLDASGAGGVHAAQGHRGRHPRRRQPRPDRGDARPARRPGRQRALQAGHGRAGPMTRRMVAAVQQPAHQRARPLHRPDGDGRPRDPQAVPVRREGGLRGLRRGNDVAVEINSRPERRDPPTRLLELARDLGCLFSIDSDAHAPGQLDFLWYGAERAEAAGIDPDRIVNTWPQDRLLEWANTARFPAWRVASEWPRRGRGAAQSKRRRRTVSAYRDGEQIVVLIPASLSRKEEAEWVETMVARVQRSERTTIR